MRPCRRSSPKPWMRAAGRRRPRQPSTLRVWRRARRPLQTPSTPPAPRPHPPPFPRCPAVTQVQVGAEGGYRAGATARSACWRPPVEHRRTITTAMGLGGPAPWRTSTPSTERPGVQRCVFMVKTWLHVCFFKIRSRPITWEISTVIIVVSIWVIRLWFLFSSSFDPLVPEIPASRPWTLTLTHFHFVQDSLAVPHIASICTAISVALAFVRCAAQRVSAPDASRDTSWPQRRGCQCAEVVAVSISWRGTCRDSRVSNSTTAEAFAAVADYF